MRSTARVLPLSSRLRLGKRSPDAYAAAHRASLVRKSLNKSDTVTDAIYDAGYNSNSRFYETSNQVLGMTPSNYRAGGAQTDIQFAAGECSLGSILVAQSDRGTLSPASRRDSLLSGEVNENTYFSGSNLASICPTSRISN
jgi:hypothetical protein